MLLTNTESTVSPSAVLVERFPDGTANVRLADNVREEEREGQTSYVYDEAVFTLGANREETAEDIRADFDSWWKYGIQPEEPMPTIEERLELVEMMLIGGLDA